MRQIIRACLPRRFEWVFYRAEAIAPPEANELEIQIVGPRTGPSEDQLAFLREHMRALSLRRLLRWRCRGCGWVYFASMDGRFCHYSFVTPAARYRKFCPEIPANALLIGPCMTMPAARGRSIYPRVIQQIAYDLTQEGRGPVYIQTDTTNAASIRGMEKAGFTKCGVWAGRRAFFDLITRARKVGD